MKKISLLLVLVMLLSIFMVGCDNKQEEDKNQEKAGLSKEDIKVGFIYVGPIGDGGYTYAHDQGRLYLEEKLGVETIYAESVEEGPGCEKVLNDMIDQGCNVIFATSYGFMDYVEKVSKSNPEVKFLHCSGYKMTENMGNYFGRMYEARYLSGIVAGLKTESNEIGFVGAFDIPEVVRAINAFTLGVQSVNPDAVVKVKWTNTWYDPTKEKEAAIALLDEGADVIAQHQDTAGPQQAAEERNAFSIGYNTDMKEKAPKAYMTSAVWNWGPYYVDQVQKVMDGTWSAESYWGSMNDDIIGLAPLTENAPEGAKEAIEKAKADILSGKTKIFAGPLVDQEGEVKVKEGAEMTDQELLEFNWFIKGIEGKIETK
ncbi:BMP family ABC transporter substrate-binding protein [Desulfonispora thiosulfatigenes]|nr:BMP family ABC transporter substrate-binding protein [Desulfonispora thiosulfatigenes]